MTNPTNKGTIDGVSYIMQDLKPDEYEWCKVELISMRCFQLIKENECKLNKMAREFNMSESRLINNCIEVYYQDAKDHERI